MKHILHEGGDAIRSHDLPSLPILVPVLEDAAVLGGRVAEDLVVPLISALALLRRLFRMYIFSYTRGMRSQFQLPHVHAMFEWLLRD